MIKFRILQKQTWKIPLLFASILFILHTNIKTEDINWILIEN